MTQLTPDISVVIVTYNSAATIGVCLDSVLAERQTGVHVEVVVVDNASTDGTADQVRQRTGVRLLHQPVNTGFARGNNLGIAASRGPWILMLNPDARLMPGFLRAAITPLEHDDTIALLTGKVLCMHPDGRLVQARGGSVIDTVGVAIRRNRQTVEIGHGEIDRGQYDTGREVFAVSGAVCLCRREALLDLAFGQEILDESFFAYKEDVDLCWRARLRGWKCVYAPTPVAGHVGGWRSDQRRRSEVPRTIRRHSFKNRRLMLLKNDTLGTALPDLARILAFECVALGYVLLREPFLLAAWYDLVRLLPRAWRWRRHIHRRRRGRATELRRWFV